MESRALTLSQGGVPKKQNKRQNGGFQGLRGRGNGELLFNGNRVCNDERVLKMGGYITM